MFNFKNPFKALSNVIKTGTAAKNIAMSSNISTINSLSKGVIDYNPTNINYNSGSGTAKSSTSGSNFFVYPVDKQDQEHYILFDIIQRQDKTTSGGGHPSATTSFATNDKAGVNNPGATVQSNRLNTVIYGANRFFGEGGKLGFIPTGTGAERTVVSTIAIYMPQTLKFNFAADYGPAEIGAITALGPALKDYFSSGFDTSNLGAILQQGAKTITGFSSFITGGLGTGLNAALQRRTGIAPAAMTEMIFNGINYRDFSFTFKLTPRSKRESDVIKNMIREFKLGMLPERYGTGSIAAYKVPFEFVIRFMKGTKINPYLEQIGLCACTGVDIDHGDKFSTHSHGDPVTTNLTLTFRELELIEKKRYKELNPY